MEASTKQQLIEAVKQALMVELKGHQLYTHAVQVTEDPAAKAMFQALANDEVEHLRMLQAQHKSLLEEGKVDLGAMHTVTIDEGARHVINETFAKSVKHGTFELAAVSIGVDLERRAESFYREQAKNAEVVELKQLFEKLASWELGHFEQLHELEKLLQDEYWSRQGFAPF